MTIGNDNKGHVTNFKAADRFRPEVLVGDYVALDYRPGNESSGATGRAEESARFLERALRVNPFDPAVQQALVQGYTATGQAALAATHQRYVRILATGGAIEVAADAP